MTGPVTWWTEPVSDLTTRVFSRSPGGIHFNILIPTTTVDTPPMYQILRLQGEKLDRRAASLSAANTDTFGEAT